MDQRISNALMSRFSRDMAELYTDLLGLGEAVESGALFVASQRLVEAAVACREADPVTDEHALSLALQTAEIFATTVLIRLSQLDDRGLIPRPGRRRRLYGLSLSMLRAIRRAAAPVPAPPPAATPAAPASPAATPAAPGTATVASAGGAPAGTAIRSSGKRE
ncbi:MAG: hypothetical protein EA403_04915 [Spirochaetaceae bacterium]|nr:MAG: hypothetical protein EA403_04915 [Spirochaetaceae bacterium]